MLTFFVPSCAQLNPVADVSMSGTNLLAHGRPELMNAVAITSLAASTFNSQLDAWEPAVEPWEGLVKWESNNDPSDQALPAGSRLRVAASSVINVNVSSASVETMVAAQLAWKRNAELEEDARKELQMVSTAKQTSPTHASSAATGITAVLSYGVNILNRIPDQSHSCEQFYLTEAILLSSLRFHAQVYCT